MLHVRSLCRQGTGRPAAAAMNAVYSARQRLFIAAVLIAAAKVLIAESLPPATVAAIPVVDKCAAAQNATSDCLAKEAERLRDMASSGKRWFVNSTVGVAASAELVGRFCGEYNKASVCLCHVTSQCSEEEASFALATVQVAHFNVFANLCRHDNITREFTRKLKCYGRVEEVVKRCFSQCWLNRTCASCNESMDCATQLLGALCQRDAEFVRIIELLLRVREGFADANGCYPDSKAPLILSFRTHEPSRKCPVIQTSSHQSRPARGSLTSGGGGGGGGVAAFRDPAGTAIAAFAAGIAISAWSCYR